MGLDIYLSRVLNKDDISKLKKKHNVSDLIYPKKYNEELDKITFITIQELVSCDVNIETFNIFKNCIAEQEIGYYNVTALLLESKVKTKDKELANYCISGFSSSSIGENYTEIEFTHRNNEKDVMKLDILDDKIKNLEYRTKEVGLFIQDVSYVQRKGITINESLTGKCYRDEIFELFISNEVQLQKLNENNEYENSILKSQGFKIPESHLLYINW